MHCQRHPATMLRPLPARLDAEESSRCCRGRFACDLPIVLRFREVSPMNKIVTLLISAMVAATAAAQTAPTPSDPQPQPAQAAPAPAPPPPPQTAPPKAPPPPPPPHPHPPRPPRPPPPPPPPTPKTNPNRGPPKLPRRERKDRIKTLGEKYRQFLTDVDPILNPAELDTFL